MGRERCGAVYQKLCKYPLIIAFKPFSIINQFLAKPTEDQYWDMAADTMHADPTEFNTLNHGDFWLSNLMCNYLPDGNVNQVILIDFQICKWGSPALDLLFFIALSPSSDIRLKEFDHFVYIYWKRLTACLKLLKYKKRLPQLRDLHASLYNKKNSFYGKLAKTDTSQIFSIITSICTHIFL